MPSHLPLAAESCRAKVEESQVKRKKKGKNLEGKQTDTKQKSASTTL